MTSRFKTCGYMRVSHHQFSSQAAVADVAVGIVLLASCAADATILTVEVPSCRNIIVPNGTLAAQVHGQEAAAAGAGGACCDGLRFMAGITDNRCDRMPWQLMSLNLQQQEQGGHHKSL
jgi:hypothetical protein